MIKIKITSEHRKKARQIVELRNKMDALDGKRDCKYRRGSAFTTSFIGVLGEVVFADYFDVERLGGWVEYGRKSFGADFITKKGERLELKTTDKQHINVVKVNFDFHKKKKRKIDYYVFGQFDAPIHKAKHLKILGYMPKNEIENYPINPHLNDISPSYHIFIEDLHINVYNLCKAKGCD